MADAALRDPERALAGAAVPLVTVRRVGVVWDWHGWDWQGWEALAVASYTTVAT